MHGQQNVKKQLM